MDKNHPRARHYWIQIEVQIGPSVIKQWAFPLGHLGTAAVRLCGWSPLQRCEMEIILEVKLHSKRVQRKAVNIATPSPNTGRCKTNTLDADLLRSAYFTGRMGERGMIRIPMKLATKPSLSKTRLRVLMWTLLTDCRCSSQSLVPWWDWMGSRWERSEPPASKH